MTYKKVKIGTVETNVIKQIDDQGKISFIPKDMANADYKKFIDSGAALEEAD